MEGKREEKRERRKERMRKRVGGKEARKKEKGKVKYQEGGRKRTKSVISPENTEGCAPFQIGH